MTRELTAAALLCALTLAVVGTASALDGNRQGWFVGGGLGIGSTIFTPEIAVNGMKVSGEGESKVGLTTDFELGFGINETATLYWNSRVNWTTFSDRTLGDLTVASGVGSINIAKFVQPQAPTAFFSGGIGFSSFSAPFEQNAKASYGLGLRAGAGYEFRPHWAFELGLSWGNPSETESGVEYTLKSVSIMFTLIGLAY